MSTNLKPVLIHFLNLNTVEPRQTGCQGRKVLAPRFPISPFVGVHLYGIRNSQHLFFTIFHPISRGSPFPQAPFVEVPLYLESVSSARDSKAPVDHRNNTNDLSLKQQRLRLSSVFEAIRTLAEFEEVSEVKIAALDLKSISDQSDCQQVAQVSKLIAHES